MQTVAAAVHSGVAALAAGVAAALTPPTIVSVATAASTFLLIDSTWVDDEVMRDLLSEDLMGVVFDGTKRARLLCPSRPGEPWSSSPGLLRDPVVAVEPARLALRAGGDSRLFARRRLLG